MRVVGYKPTSKKMSDRSGASAHIYGESSPVGGFPSVGDWRTRRASFFFNPTDGRRGMRSLEFPVPC